MKKFSIPHDEPTTIELDIVGEQEEIGESLIVKMKQGFQKIIEGTTTFGTMSLNSTPTLQTPPSKDNHLVPYWFQLSVSKKRSLVLVTLPVKDLFRKCLGKTPKTKRSRIETIINIDDETWQWVVEVMKPTSRKRI